VVVADDDPAMRALISHALTDSGYRPYTAMDVREAIDQLRHPGVAAAIVDMLFVNSGGRSGLDVLRFIRENPGLRHLPIIVLTGFPLNHEVVAEIESRHAELWYKPVDVGHITMRLDDILQAQIVRT
jgi:two-component system phosphate regulon response regulator PhoB